MELREGDYEKGGNVRATAAVVCGVALMLAGSGLAVASAACVVLCPAAAPGWAIAALLAWRYAVDAFAAA